MRSGTGQGIRLSKHLYGTVQYQGSTKNICLLTYMGLRTTWVPYMVFSLGPVVTQEDQKNKRLRREKERVSESLKHYFFYL